MEQTEIWREVKILNMKKQSGKSKRDKLTDKENVIDKVFKY